jgi:hypothetical protein
MLIDSATVHTVTDEECGERIPEVHVRYCFDEPAEEGSVTRLRYRAHRR